MIGTWIETNLWSKVEVGVFGSVIGVGVFVRRPSGETFGENTWFVGWISTPKLTTGGRANGVAWCWIAGGGQTPSSSSFSSCSWPLLLLLWLLLPLHEFRLFCWLEERLKLRLFPCDTTQSTTLSDDPAVVEIVEVKTCDKPEIARVFSLSTFWISLSPTVPFWWLFSFLLSSLWLNKGTGGGGRNGPTGIEPLFISFLFRWPQEERSSNKDKARYSFCLCSPTRSPETRLRNSSEEASETYWSSRKNFSSSRNVKPRPIAWHWNREMSFFVGFRGEKGSKPEGQMIWGGEVVIRGAEDVWGVSDESVDCCFGGKWERVDAFVECLCRKWCRRELFERLERVVRIRNLMFGFFVFCFFFCLWEEEGGFWGQEEDFYSANELNQETGDNTWIQRAALETVNLAVVVLLFESSHNSFITRNNVQARHRQKPWFNEINAVHNDVWDVEVCSSRENTKRNTKHWQPKKNKKSEKGEACEGW